MAPNIRIPANFGKKRINSPVHGNLLLKLRDGEEIRTNSMIMSLNSPVIDRLTSELHQSTLEMEDFTKGAVDCFVESMYTGDVESLQKQIFEDVNKMAHVFEVSWLSKRCLKFYKSYVLNFENNSYQEVLFACEIASRAHYNLKQSRYVGCFVKNLMTREISQTVFLRRYMANFAELSQRQIEMSLAVAGKGSYEIAMILLSHITAVLKSEKLDKNALSLLKSFDVSSFRQNYPVHFKDIASLLIDISKDSKSSEVKEVARKFIQGKSCSSTDDALQVVDTAEEHEEDFPEEDFPTQTDEEPERGWIEAVSQSKCDLISGNMLQLITKDDAQEGHIGVECTFKSAGGNTAVTDFGIKPASNSSRWNYFIGKCTKRIWNTYYLTTVPSDKVKHWIITKTSTHLKIVCNKVTVLNFNFTTDCDPGMRTGKDIWSREIDYCKLCYDRKFLLILQ